MEFNCYDVDILLLAKFLNPRFCVLQTIFKESRYIIHNSISGNHENKVTIPMPELINS